MMYTVLLSGGSGKRLWPLSNDLRSKQYLKVVKGTNGQTQSMIQRVWSQLETEGLAENAIITAGKSQVEIIKSQLGTKVEIAIEPCRRDTFPAIALSCTYLHSVLNAKESDPVSILPVDPFTDQTYFQTVRSLESVLNETKADLILMGANPTYPSSKYGYILLDKSGIPSCTVTGFVEKPSEEKAGELIRRGALWNCGVFCFRIGYILDYLRSLSLPTDYSELYAIYDQLPKISFDYEIAEKCKNISAVRFEGCWKDLGTWNTLSEEMGTPFIGNCVVSDTSINTNVINELEIPIVVIGGKNLIVAASADGILVSDKAESSYMKEYIRDIGEYPMYEERRWGSLKVIDISKNNDMMTMTRRIQIRDGMNSSLHYHENRDEIWTILSGSGTLLLDGRVIPVKAGDSIRIPSQKLHAIRADCNLDIVEIQIGKSIGSEDITRILYEWDEIWNRYFETEGMDNRKS